MTQQELMEECKKTELMNTAWLETYQKLETEKKNVRRVKKKFLCLHFCDFRCTGPRIHFHSFASHETADDEEKHNHVVAKSLVTFIECDPLQEWKSKSPGWHCEMILIGFLGAPTPTKKAVCVVTGTKANYLDPLTQFPFATVDAFKVLRRSLRADGTFDFDILPFASTPPSSATTAPTPSESTTAPTPTASKAPKPMLIPEVIIESHGIQSSLLWLQHFHQQNPNLINMKPPPKSLQQQQTPQPRLHLPVFRYPLPSQFSSSIAFKNIQPRPSLHRPSPSFPASQTHLHSETSAFQYPLPPPPLPPFAHPQQRSPLHFAPPFINHTLIPAMPQPLASANIIPPHPPSKSTPSHPPPPPESAPS